MPRVEILRVRDSSSNTVIEEHARFPLPFIDTSGIDITKAAREEMDQLIKEGKISVDKPRKLVTFSNSQVEDSLKADSPLDLDSGTAVSTMPHDDPRLVVDTIFMVENLSAFAYLRELAGWQPPENR